MSVGLPQSALLITPMETALTRHPAALKGQTPSCLEPTVFDGVHVVLWNTREACPNVALDEGGDQALHVVRIRSD